MKQVCFLLLCLSSISHAQHTDIFKPDSVKKKLLALESTNPLRIDGVLDEADWKRLKPSPRFTQIEPFQGEVPNHDTEIKVLYDNKNLYFGIICYDSLGKKAIRATDFKRDFDYRTHDLVTLCFDGFNDQRNAMSIVVNPYGVQRDYLSFDALYYDIEWDGLWSTRTSRTDSGWVAEISIPWQTLRYPETEEAIQNWGFQLYRNRRLSNEITAFSPFPRSFGAARMDYAGLLTNLKPPPSRLNIRIQPYILSSYDRYKNFSPEIKPEEMDLKVGGELKWAINPNSVLDLTFNTDFAQADVDRLVNNTSRFSVLFPERRQFFLENASLFGINVGPGARISGGSMRIQPFFSRRIGLNDNGNPIPIVAGGRFVHRSSERNYGVILMRQSENNLMPATNFLVGRFSENFGKQNRLGGLLTIKNRPDSSNITGTVDAFIRLAESHSLYTMISYSTTANENKQGFSGVAQYLYSTNKWKAWWTQSVITKDFIPEMGFVSRTDVIGTTPGIIGYFRGNKLPFKKWLRAFEPGVNVELYHQASSAKLIERQLTVYPIYLNLQTGGYFGYGIVSAYQNLTEPFSPLDVTIQTGEYNYIQHTFLASTDPSKKLNAMATINRGTYFNGHMNSEDLQFHFAPIPHISLGGRFNRIHFNKLGEEQITKTVDLYSIEGRFALNPRLQLTTFYQRNSENDLQNLNIRFSWEYQALSYIYFVYNIRNFEVEMQDRAEEHHIIGKVSFLKHF